MKKVIALLCTLFLLAGCNSTKTYTSLDYDQLKAKIDNKESFVLVISRTGCPHCVNYKKTVNKAVKQNNIDIYMVDMANFSDEQINNFKTVIKWDGSTPETVFVDQGIETSTYNRLVGDVDYDKLINKLKKMNYIE